MQIFLQSRGTDWSALFCASKPACSCIYRDGRCLTDSGMTQPAPVFFIFFQQPFGFVIRGRYILVMEEKKMIFLILFYPFVQVVSITVVFPRLLIVVFIPSYGQDCFITFFKFGDGLRIWLF